MLFRFVFLMLVIPIECLIRDGETIMLGGIFQQKQQEHTAKIPFLSSIPLLGVLFSHKVFWWSDSAESEGVDNAELSEEVVEIALGIKIKR